MVLLGILFRASHARSMDQQRFIEELYELSEATRRLARAVADPAISARLVEIADEVAMTVRAERGFSLSRSP